MKRQLPLFLAAILLSACASQQPQEDPTLGAVAPAPTPPVTAPVETASVPAPAPVEAPAQPEAPIETESYLIQPGDSLWKIANERNTSVRRLMSINKMQKNFLRAGDTLLVPKMAQPAATPAAPAPAPAAPAAPGTY
jgi:LysM repeat protein